MKVLVTGAKGQLGHDVVKRLEKLNIECLGVDIQDFDLTCEEETKKFLLDYRPDTVIHCAAFTAVDKAEDEKEKCYKINVNGTRYLAEGCGMIGARMVYISTDYVFDGKGTEPFETTDKADPINYYGQTKWEGELEVQKAVTRFYIIRISWVFGINGNNFIKTVLRLGREKDQVNIVSDQIGSPTYTYDLARLISDMIATERYGTYHATNEGYCSWYEFAVEILEKAGIATPVNPIRTEDYPSKAARPKNSRLSKKSLDEAGFDRLPEWRNALQRYIAELTD